MQTSFFALYHCNESSSFNIKFQCFQSTLLVANTNPQALETSASAYALSLSLALCLSPVSLLHPAADRSTSRGMNAQSKGAFTRQMNAGKKNNSL